MRPLIAIISSLTILLAADPPAPVAAKPVEFVEGCNAMLYTSKVWPIGQLPEAPAEVVKLPSLPVVRSNFDGRAGGNLLVASALGILDDAHYYAVVFDGYFFSADEGKYGFTITSDDPIQTWIEGTEIPGLKSDFTVLAPEVRGDSAIRAIEQMVVTPKTATVSDSVLLGANRWYRVTILCSQVRVPVYFAKSYPEDERNRAGAFFRAFVTSPAGATVPLTLHLKK